MNFEADRLADYFTRALDFMLAGYFWSEAKNNNIKGNIESYKKLRDEFTTTADPEDALQLIVRTKVTNAFYRELSDEKKSNFESDFN